MNSALDVFAERGFSGARTSEIAQKAGVSEALLFQHFKSKNDLYDSIIKFIAEEHEGLSCCFVSTLDSAEDGLDAIAFIAKHIVNAGSMHKKRNDPFANKITKLFFQNLMTDGRFAKDLIRHRSEKVIPVLDRSILVAQEKGVSISFTGEELFWLLHNLGSGIFINSLSTSIEGLGEKTLDKSIYFVLKAIGFSDDMIEMNYGSDLWEKFLKMVES